MKSSKNNPNDENLRRLNQLKESVQKKSEYYHQCVNSLWVTERELTEHKEILNKIISSKLNDTASEKNEKLIIKKLEEKLHFFHQKISSKQSKNLLNEIEAGITQIEKLEKERYGKSNRHSPSILAKREI